MFDFDGAHAAYYKVNRRFVLANVIIINVIDIHQKSAKEMR
jgi:hypothetical protein